MKTNFFYLAVAIATTSLFCYSESAGAQAIIVEEDVSVTEVVLPSLGIILIVIKITGLFR